MVRPTMLCALLFAALTLGVPSIGVANADWSRYVDPRSGAGVDIPPGFSVDVAHEVAGTGRLFRSSDGRVFIRVSGRVLGGDEFTGVVDQALAGDQSDGWTITFRSQTPDWAAWSGARGGTLLHARIIPVCGESQIASVRMTYPALDDPDFEPVFERVSASLAQDGGCY